LPGKTTSTRSAFRTDPIERSIRLSDGCFFRRCCFCLLFCLYPVPFLISAPATAAEKLTYHLTLSGLDAPGLDSVRAPFKEASLLEAARSTSFLSVSNLRKNLKSDVALMRQILRAEGYYGSSVTDRMKRQKNHFQISITVDSGPRYSVGEIRIDYRAPVPADEIRRQVRDRIGKNPPLRPGAPARAANVIRMHAHLAEILPEHGFPFAREITRDIVVDHRLKTMDITFSLESGIRRHMRAVHLKGLRSIDENYIRKFIPWRERDIFDQRQIRALQARLNRTGLFSTIDIDVSPADPDQADITITFTETKHRTIGAAAGYSTAEGVSGELSWDHRNFLGRGNHLKLVARGAEIEQFLSSRLEIPHFSRLDQTLSFEASYQRQDTDAFIANIINTSAGLNRVITDQLALRAGLELEYSDIIDAESDSRFYLASLPVGARWDSSDDLLNPGRGVRLSLITAPSIGVDGEQFTFLKSELRASVYYALRGKDAIVAGRVRLGSIIGAETASLPATRRFYAGGGGSVRGYSFQRIGPVNADDIPLGGRAVTEIAAELRWRFMPHISIVPFVEGGNIEDSEFPTLAGLRWAVGMGARYHTQFGPVRLDVAFPLNRREGDSGFQLYISLGQAF